MKPVGRIALASAGRLRYHPARSAARNSPGDNMHRQRRLIAAVALLGLALPGCASRLLVDRAAGQVGPSSAADKPDLQRNAPSQTLAKADEQKLQEIMAELRQAGLTDPIAQDQLFEDLRQSDPSLWPLVMQQFRATQAYRQRMAARNRELYAERLPPVDRTVPSTAVPNSQGAETSDVVQASYGAPVQAAGYPSTDYPAPPSHPPPSHEAPGYEAAPYAAAPQPPASQVSSYQPPRQQPTVEDWRQRLSSTISALENETPWTPSSPAEISQHARLRMLYAAADRREDAMRPIAGTVPAAQQFLSKQMDGLTTWLDVERNPDPAARAATTKASFAASLASLSELAPLELRNLAFCSQIQSYGCVKRFEKYEFTADQDVLLYCEVENFRSEQMAKGYHTALRSCYQITDSGGEKVVEHGFPPTEEYCQNLRHDFFIGYRLRLPKRLVPGDYTLQLTVEDQKCQKSGQAAIQFRVKEGKGFDAKAESGKAAPPAPPLEGAAPPIQRLPPPLTGPAG